MAIIKPFKGIRPPKDLVEQVESRPYDVLDSEEARAEAGDNEKGWLALNGLANLYFLIPRKSKC